MFEWINSPEAWIALLTLTILEIVLGIDNIIFIAILSDRVKEEQRARARRVGLTIAISTRILLLFSIVWIMRLTAPLFTPRAKASGFAGIATAETSSNSCSR